VKQELYYFIKLRLGLFDYRLIFKSLESVLLPFYHYCHGPATQPRVISYVVISAIWPICVVDSCKPITVK